MALFFQVLSANKRSHESYDPRFSPSYVGTPGTSDCPPMPSSVFLSFSQFYSNYNYLFHIKKEVPATVQTILQKLPFYIFILYLVCNLPHPPAPFRSCSIIGWQMSNSQQLSFDRDVSMYSKRKVSANWKPDWKIHLEYIWTSKRPTWRPLISLG